MAHARGKPGASQTPHLSFLDGLRGVAILMVVAVHSSQLVAGLTTPVRDLAFYGVRGVQLFFIVSGYTLTINHLGKPIRPLDFASRRFFRIAPMFYLGAVLYLVLSWSGAMVLPAAQASAVDIASTLLFLHGWLPSAINTVVPGGWSIAAEMMFYCCFPLLLRMADRPRMLGLTLVACFVIAIATTVGLRHLHGAQWTEMGRYFWLVQLPAFVGGCWLAALSARDALPRRGARAAMALAIIGMAIDSQWRGHSVQFVAMVLLLLFAWGAIMVRPRWLEHPLLVTIGRISFSLYLLHFAVLGAVRPLARTSEAWAGAGGSYLITFAVTLALSGLLAACTFRWIEQPAIALGRRRAMT